MRMRAISTPTTPTIHANDGGKEETEWNCHWWWRWRSEQLNLWFWTKDHPDLSYKIACVIVHNEKKKKSSRYYRIIISPSNLVNKADFLNKKELQQSALFFSTGFYYRYHTHDQNEKYITTKYWNAMPRHLVDFSSIQCPKTSCPWPTRRMKLWDSSQKFV